MRILLASDGSNASMVAADLVRSLAWPSGSTVRVVVVDETADDLSLASWLGQPVSEPARPEATVRPLHQLIDRLEADLSGEGITIERAAPRGRPASAILHQAIAFDADLIVLGSRGHGTIGTMLLGSVAAEVVDGTSCPVLVARTGQVRSMLLGVDGSAPAAAAVDIVRDPSFLPGVPATLASVADVHVPLLVGLESAYGAFAGLYEEQTGEAVRHHAQICAVALARLAGSGRRVHCQALTGDPATELIDAARRGDHDLIVVGTTGRTGFRRMLLGSVARNVVLHADCSVLVVPDPARRRLDDLARVGEPMVEQAAVQTTRPERAPVQGGPRCTR